MDGGVPAEAAADVVREATKSDAGYPGPHSDAPQVASAGGPVLAAPNVVPIFYADDPRKDDVASFLGAAIRLLGGDYIRVRSRASGRCLADGPYGGSELVLFAQQGASKWNMWFGFVSN